MRSISGLVILCALVLGALGVCSKQLSYISTNMERALSVNIDMDPLTATWVSGGVTYVVTTNAIEGETEDEHWDRHDARVAAGLKRHPADT